ncbi:TPA: hypothetical protein QDA99_001429 [Burkholderia vietnamiensis]|nr:hypothetical protein [Burkholderia vietnamiensis]
MDFAMLLPELEIETNLGGGTTDVIKGFIGRASDAPVRAYIKFLEPKRTGLEILCNQLARSLGLNAPDAYIVKIPPDVSLPGSRGRHDDAFGTIDLGFQTISQFLRCRPDLRMYAPNLRNVLKGWPEVMVFDEWIANGGRDFHDALVDDEHNVWVIDHEKALSGGDEITLEELKTRYFTNVLAEKIAMDFSAQELFAFKEAVRRFIEKVEVIDVDRAVGESPAIAYLENEQVWAIRVFLVEQQRSLRSLVERRLSMKI